MEAKFNICKKGTCGIQVSGLEKDMDSYLDEELVSFRNYTFEQTATINIVVAINSKEEEEIESFSLVPHTDIDIDDIELKKDGLKKIDHIIIPTIEWLNYILERDATTLDLYTSGIYIISNDDKFYKYRNGLMTEVTINEIFEVNQENTTLIKGSLHTFSTCHLEECFFKLCMYLLENMPCSDPCITDKVKGFKLDILNRDIVWMVLNAIKYCIEQLKFFLALNLLERILTCWGICKDISDINSTLYKGCGCNS